MVEVLDVGTEAITCLMTGRGMNGLKGTIVCFNPNNARYTLELENGDMMSLRQRNIKPFKSNSEEGTEVSEGANASKEGYRHDGIRKELNIVDRCLFAFANQISSMSPSTVLLAIIFAYWFINSGSSGGTGADYHEYSSHRAHWHWRWPFHFGYFSVGGLMSIAIVGFFTYQFGTKKGRVRFNWNNVKDRVMLMDFWEVLRFAALLETALHGVNRIMAGVRRR